MDLCPACGHPTIMTNPASLDQTSTHYCEGYGRCLGGEELVSYWEPRMLGHHLPPPRGADCSLSSHHTPRKE